MRFLTAAFSLVLSAALAAAQGVQPVLNTPVGVQECSRTQLTWTGSPGPFDLQILPGDQPSAAPLETLGTGLSGNSFSWLCKQTAGTRIFLRLRDTSSGQLSETATITVGTGTSTCGGSSSGASSPSDSTAATTPGTSQPAATTPAATTATTPGTTPAATTGGSNTGTSRSQSSNNSRTSSGAASAPSSTQGGGAGQLKAPVALAVAGALAMAVFA